MATDQMPRLAAFLMSVPLQDKRDIAVTLQGLFSRGLSGGAYLFLHGLVSQQLNNYPAQIRLIAAMNPAQILLRHPLTQWTNETQFQDLLSYPVLQNIISHFSLDQNGRSQFPYLPLTEDYFTGAEIISRTNMVIDTLARHSPGAVVPPEAVALQLIDHFHPGERDFQFPPKYGFPA